MTAPPEVQKSKKIPLSAPRRDQGNEPSSLPYTPGSVHTPTPPKSSHESDMKSSVGSFSAPLSQPEATRDEKYGVHEQAKREPTEQSVKLENHTIEDAAKRTNKGAQQPVPRPKKYKQFPSHLEGEIQHLKDTLSKLESDIATKQASKDVNLGTSKTNYIDPRIIYSWAREQNVPINRLLSANLQEKFQWAKDAQNFSYVESAGSTSHEEAPNA